MAGGAAELLERLAALDAVHARAVVVGRGQQLRPVLVEHHVRDAWVH